jgi:hypothetical protein
MTVNGQRFFPLGDRVPGLGLRQDDLFAVPTGEHRAPRAGEWHLSGAIVAAYRAPNDLSTAYHIARVYRTTERHTREIVGEPIV